MSAQEVSSVLNYGMTKTHQIPIDHLDYSFIEKCSDIKHLEKILWVLRSGEEGHYPELTVFCEERLGNLAPQSRALRKDKPPATAADFSLEDWRNIDNDLKEWLVDIKMKAQNESVIQPDTENLPSVRSYHSLPADKKQRGKEKTGVSKKVPRDYRDWDRFDVEKELSQVEDDAERKEQSKTITHSKTSAIKKTINAAGLSMTQRRFIAENEKGKGNEAFRSGDYQEAITYYSRSISVLPSAAAYNNRAQAEIKLNNWQNALNDCERVLELDPGNTKAFLRRAITHKNLANYKAAETDLRRVLRQEPDNPVAKKAFTDVEELLQKAEEETQSKGRKIVIEDIEGSDEEYNRPFKCEKEAGVSAGEQSDMGNAQNKPFPKKNSPRSKECGAPSHSPNGVKKDCGNGQQPRNPCEEKDSLNQHSTENTSKRGSKEVKPSTEPLSSAAQLKSEGNQLFKNGQFADAAVKYSEAIGNVKHTQSENAEELAILHSNRAACHLKDGNSRECIEDCNRSLELQPFSVKPLLRRAMANESLERYRPAYVDYKTVLQIDSSIQVAHDSINRIAKTLIEQDGPNWREKLPQIPTVPVSIHLQQHGGGDSASNSSQPKSHVEHGKSPEETLQALKTEGNEYVKKGKYREAEKKYSECLKLNAEECTLYTNRALCYLKLSQYEEARSDCECALQIDTLNIKALYRRAQAYKGLEDYQACANDLQKVISVDPSITEAKKLLDEIAPFLAAADDIIRGQEKQRKKILIEEVNEADVDGEVSNNNHCNGQESAALAAKPRSPITRPANAYEFSQQLNEIKAMKDETACADLLSVMEPKDLPVLMSNKLEEDILLLIVRSMKHCLLPTAPGLVYQHLSHLSKAERFKIVVMLLSKNQKDEIRDLFDSLTQNQNGDLEREPVLSLAREYEL